MNDSKHFLTSMRYSKIVVQYYFQCVTIECKKTYSNTNEQKRDPFFGFTFTFPSYLCQVEGHGGTLVKLISEKPQKIPSTDLKNILYFDIPMYPSFICHIKFGLSPHGLDFGVFGPLWNRVSHFNV